MLVVTCPNESVHSKSELSQKLMILIGSIVSGADGRYPSELCGLS